MHNGCIYYLLARHKDTNELGDFGGGVKQTEYALTGGLREFVEESKGIFGDVRKNVNDMFDKIALVDNERHMSILFIPIDADWFQKASIAFSRQNEGKKCSDEISELVWVSENTFRSLIYYPRSQRNVMWKKIRNFFVDTYSTGFVDALRTCLLTPRIMNYHPRIDRRETMIHHESFVCGAGIRDGKTNREVNLYSALCQTSA